jgi:hypothetical protein
LNRSKSKVLNRGIIRIEIMLPMRNIEGNIGEVVKKLEISEEDRKKLGNATAGIVALKEKFVLKPYYWQALTSPVERRAYH